MSEHTKGRSWLSLRSGRTSVNIVAVRVNNQSKEIRIEVISTGRASIKND